MKVAIVGSRSAVNFNLEEMEKYLPENCDLLISGGAHGVDHLVERLAKNKKIPFQCFWPDYKTHGRRAPLVRNTQIVAAADEVLAFWDFQSRGTAFTIAECIRMGVPVQIIGLDDFNT